MMESVEDDAPAGGSNILRRVSLMAQERPIVDMVNQSVYHPDFMFCGQCTSCNDDDSACLPATSEAIHASIDTRDVLEEITSTTRHKISVENLNAPSQVLVLTSLLKALPGVTHVKVELEHKTLLVDHDAQTTVSHMCLVMNQLGYLATVDEERQQPQHVRSSFHVQGICCASECPSVRKILKTLPGVTKIQINITSKVVYVQHDDILIQATDIAARLSSQGFPATIMKDGRMPTSSRGAGRTTLIIDKVLGKHDIAPIQQLLSSIEGVQLVEVNYVESVVFMDHDYTVVSATHLSVQLGTQYKNSIACDAQNTSSGLPVKSKFVETTLHISNLTLQHIPLLERVIRQNFIASQVRAFYPHAASQILKVEHNPNLVSAYNMCDLLNRYGLLATIRRDGGEERLALPLLEEYSALHGGMQKFDTASRIHLNVLLSGIFWFIAVLSYIGGDFEYLKYAGLFSVAFGIPPVAVKAWRTMRRCEFDANCMMVVAAFGALALQEYDEAASVSFLFAVSEFLEARASLRSRKALGAIIALRPEHCNILNPVTREIVIVPADKVPVGSLIAVRTGDKISADGVVVEGTSTVDESSLTGEARPVNKRPEDLVAGGSINVGDCQLIVKTTTSVDDSAVSRLIRMVQEAQANRSPTEKLVDAFARKYTPAVMLMATIMCTVPWFYGPAVGRYWTLNGLIIIVIACPCALTISTPVTYAAGLAATAQRGIIVKGGANLEALGSVDKVIFDKTGTLTTGKFVLSHLEVIGAAIQRSEVLGMLALIESSSSHPLSASLVMAAKAEGVAIPREKVMVDHTVLKGEGVQATIDGKLVYAGNKRLFERLGMHGSLTPSCKQMTEEWSRIGGTVGFLGLEDVGIVGTFSVSDAIRPEAKDVIRQLIDNGIDVMLLTGDSDGAAKAVARQVGLPDSCVHSQLLPEDKLHRVGSLIEPFPKKFSPCSTKRLVLMCGDGINDAPALSIADIGVAMGEGAALAMEMSDITLMDSNLTKLLYILNMGSRVVMTIKENIFISLAAKVLVVGLTFAGKMTLLSAIASDVGVMLIVTLNGMKLLPSDSDKISAAPELTRWAKGKQQYSEVVHDTSEIV